MFGGNIFNTAGDATWNRVITLIMTASPTCQPQTHQATKLSDDKWLSK